MQGEALLKIGGILEKLSNDINILKQHSITTSSANSLKSLKGKPVNRPILRSSSRTRRAYSSRGSSKVNHSGFTKNSLKKSPKKKSTQSKKSIKKRRH